MPGMRISRHGKNQMRFWGITEAEIALALADPDKVTDSIKGRKNAWKKGAGYWLRVTYLEEKGGFVIVTVTPRRRGPEGENP
ncbi:MAG: hypothetical protein Q8O86_02745 [Dehalococcoidia bacterium]|nr:hypothetical protein [Dehalococcoidia bacterium]